MAKLGDMDVPEGIDVAKANRIIKWLIDVEDENNKTGKDTDAVMVQRIGKRIQEDIKCL